MEQSHAMRDSGRLYRGRSLRVLPGQYFDPETGTHDTPRLHYDPRIGRYLESDPVGLIGGLNTYGYVDGNPLSFIDRLGLAKPKPDSGNLPPEKKKKREG